MKLTLHPSAPARLIPLSEDERLTLVDPRELVIREGDQQNWNEVTIIVSDPPGEYHPNAGEGGVFEVFAVDEERTVAIAAGATITIEIDGNGACSIENVDEIVIPGVPPAPEPFDGQFLQLDLVGATIAG